MLSRIADSLYWMSRYLERADATARLLEINATHLLEAEDALPEAAEWRPLLVICGNEAAFAEITGEREPSGARVTEFMTREPKNPGSIRTSLRLARDQQVQTEDLQDVQHLVRAQRVLARFELVEELEPHPGALRERGLRHARGLARRAHGLGELLVGAPGEGG